MRKLPVIAAVSLLLTLCGCTGNFVAQQSCAPRFDSGTSAALVTARGSFGQDPQAAFPTPLVVKDSSQVTVISDNDLQAQRVNAGATTVVQLTIYNGQTGDLVVSTDYSRSGLVLTSTGDSAALGSIVQCARVGSRVSAVGAVGELIGEAGIQQNAMPLLSDDTVVIVVDVKSVYLGKANGADQLLESGFPSIVLAPDGRPGFTFPDLPAPSNLKIAALKLGDGAKVSKGDKVFLHYTGVLWGGTEVFDSTWDRNTPVAVPAVSLEDSATGVVPGFAQALIGKRVGSQMIAVIPPQFGYPAGSSPAAIPDGSTMVFVIDILGIDEGSHSP
ncbi:MAG: FKBP-type peptidyl-prolyl cis-trans isomerase [Rhodoglobus sp.]